MLREVSGFLFAMVSSDFYTIRQFYAKRCYDLCSAKRVLFAFAQRSGAMKSPVGTLSDRTVLRSKMEGPRPDKFRFGDKIGCAMGRCRLVEDYIRKRVYGFANGTPKLSTEREAKVKNGGKRNG